MKVVCPYLPGRLNPATRFVLDTLPSVEFHALWDDQDYRYLLRRLWDARDAVVIVEEDIVPWPGCVEELHACPGVWCTCSYHYNGGVGIQHMLGCAKLSAALMDALPNLWDDPCHWSVCDQRLFFAARELGIEPHTHRPAVTHLKGMV